MAAVDVPDGTLMMERIQELTERLDAQADPEVRAIADALTSTIVQFYGAGLARIMQLVDDPGRLSDDELVGGLLMVHDLYPVSVEERVGQALDRVRPYMESHGGNVELLGIDNGIARLRLQGSCSSCRASSATLELAVRQAIEELAPDLDGMDVEGLMPEPELAGFPGVALPMAAADAAPAWHDVEGLDLLESGELATASAAGVDLLVANVDGTLLAYRDRCAGCGSLLDGGELIGVTLVCPSCSRGFAITRAGRSTGDAELQLDPVPLLREGSRVRVALAS